ncbi:CTD kinase subunit gamma [Fusarium odoratissimum]|uniref:CTD kinase subunit gamma n=1 Tax=Fusarium oxysporum f. sp. cubense (strain race 4) TaxID=2502994 RepID=N1RE90_FUSC4|nr:CTD kinase subunit gamma [Fusarium odoratissimum]
MADPFEVRMRFTSQLQHLNASVTSAQKAAQYALRFRDMDEDLHSCILEQLERNNMNIRANIMYFIEHFLDMAQRDGHPDYIRMMQRDIIRVVDAVAPDDGSGAANVKVVRKVLQGLQGKGYLEPQAVSQIEDVIKERETNVTAPMLSLWTTLRMEECSQRAPLTRLAPAAVATLATKREGSRSGTSSPGVEVPDLGRDWRGLGPCISASEFKIPLRIATPMVPWIC